MLNPSSANYKLNIIILVYFYNYRYIVHETHCKILSPLKYLDNCSSVCYHPLLKTNPLRIENFLVHFVQFSKFSCSEKSSFLSKFSEKLFSFALLESFFPENDRSDYSKLNSKTHVYGFMLMERLLLSVTVHTL